MTPITQSDLRRLKSIREDMERLSADLREREIVSTDTEQVLWIAEMAIRDAETAMINDMNVMLLRVAGMVA